MRILAIKIIKLNKAYFWQNCKYVILPNYYSNKPLLTSWFKFSIMNRHTDSFTPLSFIHSCKNIHKPCPSLCVTVMTETQTSPLTSTQPHAEDGPSQEHNKGHVRGNPREEEEGSTQPVRVRDKFRQK